MMPQNILTATQIRALDTYTITHEPISSINLMERASRAFVLQFMTMYPRPERPIVICCGCGNNGGDGWAIGRLLHEATYDVHILSCRISTDCSPDCIANEARATAKRVIPITEIQADDTWPALPENCIIIDGLFGTGLSRPITGYWADFIEFLNAHPATRIAIDIPSGLLADGYSTGAVFEADHTFSFHSPKTAFFLAENEKHVGLWQVLDIGLSKKGQEELVCSQFHLTQNFATSLLKHRSRFAHKGTFGHCLVVAGSYGKVGAAVLSAKAALRMGCGLVTTHLPRCGYEIMQIAFPEAMVMVDKHEMICTAIATSDEFSTVAVGPGLGTNKLTVKALAKLLSICTKPMVLDADALNILSLHPELQKSIPANSILTPHPKEFERLFGATTSDFDRLEVLKEKAIALHVFIILKGGNSVIATPNGLLFFNTTGNPGMGTAGAGDVLTGMLGGLLAQDYSALATCQLGVFLHGLAGDIAAKKLQQQSVIAEDIIGSIGEAYGLLMG